ncbi:MAG: TIGR00269 family protein [Candidatus Bathyarchaeota archaeon]|nr:TIGR00269 family protein [Candidatus Bathyarchaeum tardum]WGM88929.1 MAG: TIGR00269 family protein [Candidatus Bathyarchaeum tardum]WNZ28832.1 MAG: TIGR00269 family protein [Candidatus Bathyarchaeota archaeon]
MTVCTLCKRNDAVFGRSYSGEKLCKRCFCRTVEDRVRKTIARYDMLKPIDEFMLAVSGGKDSITLLHILAKLEKGFPGVKFCAGTVDEGIRDYRDEALKIAKDNCKKLGIDHVVVSFKELFGYELDEIVELIKKKQKKGLTACSYCGVLRRRALNTLAREKGFKKLVTAHNLDDETQTMLLNVIHGDPFRIGRAKPVLNVIHPKLVQRVKPLCMVPEKEVVFYSYLKGIEFQCIDCPYAQDALRNDIRDMLGRIEHKHSGTLFTVFKSMEKLQPALEDYIKQTKLTECKICGEPTVEDICRPCEMLQEIKVL